jgi:hypothetical protein
MGPVPIRLIHISKGRYSVVICELHPQPKEEYNHKLQFASSRRYILHFRKLGKCQFVLFAIDCVLDILVLVLVFDADSRVRMEKTS